MNASMTFNSVSVKLTTMTSWKQFTNMLTKLLALHRKAFYKTPDFYGCLIYQGPSPSIIVRSPDESGRRDNLIPVTRLLRLTSPASQ